MRESVIQRAIRAALGKLRLPFFRYQVGTFIAADGSMVNIGVKGVSDLIGMTPHVIRPEDVGKTVAIFTALECKQAKGQVRKEQAAFLKTVNRLGGIGAIVRSDADAEAVVTEKWDCELVKKWTE
jgi:hypothetical protein